MEEREAVYKWGVHRFYGCRTNLLQHQVLNCPHRRILSPLEEKRSAPRQTPCTGIQLSLTSPTKLTTAEAD
ncbi:hypothetical protein PBY51_007410 [Eleginops maclovinus]|uniref:Uncharacterized protein n=1 Tax=Eleginops maclovinus TaxID=56733 RepID=A0AAN7X172_ELEMC|nr:hypothetical protein PBY51_007410 [Eleginops maclovinus]